MIDRIPRRQIMRQVASEAAGFDNIAQAVEDLAQRVGALQGIRGHEH